MELAGALAYFVTVLFILGLLIFFVLWLLASIITAFSGVPFVASHEQKIRKQLAQLNPKKGVTFYDLGSGDGRIVFMAAQKFELKAIGVEFNPILIAYSRIRAQLFGVKDATFIRSDFLKLTYEDADIVYMYLYPFLLERLAPKLRKECKKGTLIMSHWFKIDSMEDKLYKTIDDKPFPTFYYKL